MRRSLPQPRFPRGFTLIEAVMGMLLVSVLLAGALSAAGASARMRQAASDRDFGGTLAADLCEEIAQKGYGTTAGGTIATTNTAGSRASLTTIDQYNGLDEQPPVTSLGGGITGSTLWRRQTTVRRVTVADPSIETTSETGVKSITISVSRSGAAVFEMQMLRTSGWDVSRN